MYFRIFLKYKKNWIISQNCINFIRRIQIVSLAIYVTYTKSLCIHSLNEVPHLPHVPVVKMVQLTSIFTVTRLCENEQFYPIPMLCSFLVYWRNGDVLLHNHRESSDDLLFSDGAKFQSTTHSNFIIFSLNVLWKYSIAPYGESELFLYWHISHNEHLITLWVWIIWLNLFHHNNFSLFFSPNFT